MSDTIAKPRCMIEFPDFGEADLPEGMPTHWTDDSWHNDACPFWTVSPNVGLFVDYLDAAKSDFPESRAAGDLKRFTVVPLQNGQHWHDGDRPDLGDQPDDFQEALAQALAWEFRCALADVLDEAEFAAMREMNGSHDPAKQTCASHDFCDANLVMDMAFKAVLGTSIGDREQETGSGITDSELELWNRAWAIAARLHLGKGVRP